MHDDMGAWRAQGPRDPISGESRSCVEAVRAAVIRSTTAKANPLIPEQAGSCSLCLDVPDARREGLAEPDQGLLGADDECWTGAIKGDPGFFDADLWGVAPPVAGEFGH